MSVLIGLACLARPSAAVEPARFDVVYDVQADQACAAARGYVIHPEWIAELNNLLPEYRALWQQQGSAMFQKAEAITGQALQRYIVPIQLTLCDTPSQSLAGPVVNMRFALRAFTPQPVPLRLKVDTAFHESLHAFIATFSASDSALLRSHRSEPACVRNHLHLMALHKAVLLSLGYSDELRQVVALDSQLPSTCYKRTWKLLNQAADSYQQYVSEIARRPLAAADGGAIALSSEEHALLEQLACVTPHRVSADDITPRSTGGPAAIVTATIRCHPRGRIDGYSTRYLARCERSDARWHCDPSAFALVLPVRSGSVDLVVHGRISAHRAVSLVRYAASVTHFGVEDTADWVRDICQLRALDGSSWELACGAAHLQIAEDCIGNRCSLRMFLAEKEVVSSPAGGSGADPVAERDSVAAS